GTGYSDFDPRQERDAAAIAAVHAMDRRGLGEARAVFTISGNVAERLRRHNEISAEVLYPPSQLDGRLRAGPSGDAIFTIGRLDAVKRNDLLVRALAHTDTPVRARIAGRGRESESLRELAARLGVGERVDLLGFLPDERVVEEYANALGVFFAPYGEDYGFVTVEAFQAGKPVITTADAGGALEFVRDGENGFVCAPEPKAVAAALDRLFRDRELAQRLGDAGRERVRSIGWDAVVDQLTAVLR